MSLELLTGLSLVRLENGVLELQQTNVKIKMRHFTTDSHLKDVALVKSKSVEISCTEELRVERLRQVEWAREDVGWGRLPLKLLKHLVSALPNMSYGLLYDPRVEQLGSL